MQYFKDNLLCVSNNVINHTQVWHYDKQCYERFVPENHSNTWREEFDRDRARILHSSGLRRLGAKTQVLGPDHNDFSRTRLTHSLEVAQIGRALAGFLGADPDVVDAACLAHDIGHPPFGHNGERALARVSKDCGGFEGNAQTFRLLARLEPKVLQDGKPYGLNLTRAVLDACCKYPWTASNAPEVNGVKTHKFGVYEDDLEVFQWVRSTADLSENKIRKCIEAQIMDLSDDIAYCVHDVEDSIKLQATDVESLSKDSTMNEVILAVRDWYAPKLSLDALASAYDRLLKQKFWLKSFDGSYTDLMYLKNMTSELINRFCVDACNKTRQVNNMEVFGRYSGDVRLSDETLAEIMILKGIAVAKVMKPREDDPQFWKEQNIITELFEALNEPVNAMQFLDPMYRIWWDKAQGSAKQRVIVDQLASLTDHSAIRMHQNVCGELRLF